MGLYENFPFVNQHGLNLDWMLKKIKELEDAENETSNAVTALQGSVTTIETNITHIYEMLADIDLSDIVSRITALEGEYTTLHNSLNNVTLRVVHDEELIEANTGNIATNTEDIDNNNIGSINRDNALSARIAQLERATLHDIYNYYSDGNMLLFGSDLRNLPSECKDGGFPINYGNKLNKHLAVGTETVRAWKLTSKGFEVDTTNSSYDYYQMGKFPPSLGVVSPFTVTFCVSTGGDATGTWYSHTFQGSSEQWTIRSGCIVRLGTFLDGDSTVYSVQFLGTPANWLNIVPSGSCIPYIYVEYGNGSVDTSASAKPKFSMKDRLFFTGNEPVIPTPSNFAENKSQDVDAFYYDAVGDQVNYKLPTTNNIRVWWFNKMLSGFITINCKPTSEATGVTQLDGINENGCYAEYDLSLTNSTIPVIGFNSHFPVYDMVGNKQGEAYLMKGDNDTVMTKVHVKLASTGFVINGVTDKYLQIPFNALLQ